MAERYASPKSLSILMQESRGDISTDCGPPATTTFSSAWQHSLSKSRLTLGSSEMEEKGGVTVTSAVLYCIGFGIMKGGKKR